MYNPHGGKLISRIIDDEKNQAYSQDISNLKTIPINNKIKSDIINIVTGVFSPLEGFLPEDDYSNVLQNMRLSNNIPWTIPIVLDAGSEQLKHIKEGDSIALTDSGSTIAAMELENIYSFDKSEMAQKVFGTTDKKHPGVNKVYSMKENLLGGKITLINKPETPFDKYFLTPYETRHIFLKKGWDSVVGFQTRNVPHIGHEYLQKTSLSLVDGVFINPVIGKKKTGDFKDAVILDSYEALLKNYFPEDRAMMSIFQTEMHYAGPREAIFHAIVRKNFGCTHFIVGRDHAGVGDYYSPYAAQEIFNEFNDLEIQPIFFKSFFFCKKCNSIANDKTCPHDESQHINFSGTEIRNAIINGEKPSSAVMRPEVAETIIKYDNPFVD